MDAQFLSLYCSLSLLLISYCFTNIEICLIYSKIKNDINICYIYKTKVKLQFDST